MEPVIDPRIASTFQTEKGKLLNYIQKKVQDTEEAEDILQDSFYRALANQNSLMPVESFLAWIYRSIQNRIIDWYRKKKTSKTNFASEAELSSLPDSKQSVEQEFFNKNLEKDLQEAIGSLPSEWKMVFVKQVLQGKTFKAIAQETGISINTLISRKQYAIEFLQKKLRKSYNF
ncbi:MAG: sigma-70 family RNA polymerase sigma factor [Spirochaetota bacterium]